MITNIKVVCVMLQLRGLLGTNYFYLERRLAMLGTNVPPISGTSRNKLNFVPKATIPRGTYG